MSLFSSLTNRIFFGCALLAVASIAIAIYNVNVAVTRQAEQELRGGLDEAGTIIDEYHQILVDHFTREARLIADLPRLKATVDTNNPVTVQPLAEEYQRQLAADLLLITGRSGQTLAEIASANVSTGSYASLPGFTTASIGRESTSFWPHTGGILQVVTVPIYIGLQQPELLGTLSVGVSLDEAAANRFQRLTNSDIAFGMRGAIRASTLPKDVWQLLAPLLSGPELSQSVPLGNQDYIAKTSPLRTGPVKLAVPAAAAAGNAGEGATVIILRSRTQRLGFLNPLHGRLGIIAVVAVLAATLLSYAIARTITQTARSHYRDHARNGGHGRSDQAYRRAAGASALGGRGCPAPRQHVQHDDGFNLPLPARGGAAGAALVPGPFVDGGGARDPEPVDDHQDGLAPAARTRSQTR